MLKTIQRILKAAGVKFVRILWCDHANVIRVKATHIDFMDGLERGVGISAAQLALPVMHDVVAPNSGLGPVGEVQLVPDWKTLAVLPYAQGHAQVIGDMTMADGSWEHCPRDFLRSQVRALSAHGLTIRASFENEFVLLRRSDNGVVPVDTTIYAMSHGMNINKDVVLDIAAALESQGIDIDYYYAESAPGQQEMSVLHAEALAAADRQVVFRETVRGVASQHGLVASFLPTIFEKSAGSGCHINLSLWHTDKDVTGDKSHDTGLSAQARAFIGGVLHHLPGLSALTVPSSNSFRRIRPHVWAGAFVAWGYGNREAAVRVTRGVSGVASRFELKTADASANPYLALGGLLAAGLDGVKRNLPLPAEVTLDPGLIPMAEREAKGIHALPSSFGEALHALRQDEVLLEALGAARAKAYLAVKEMEWEALKDIPLEREVELLLERY